MPSDVNNPDGSSPEEQRKSSASHAEDDSQLDGSLQTLAEKPGVSDIVDRLMKGSTDDGADPELENHNEDEEGKETDDSADDAEEVKDGDEKPDGEDGDDEVVDGKPKPKAKPVADPEGEAAAEDEPEESADDSDEKPKPIEQDDDSNDDQYGNGANKRIRQLIARNKTAEARIAELEAERDGLTEKASYREILEKTLTDHQVDTKTWDEWTKLGLLMQSDPARAARTLGTMAKALGYQDPDGPIAKLDADLEEMVKSNDMTAEAAEKMQRQRIKTAPLPPIQRQADPTQSENNNRSPSLPRLTRDDQAVGAKAIAAVDAEFRKKYPDQWTKLAPEVQAMMAEYKGSPPNLWGKIARDCAEKVVAKRMAKAPKSTRPDPSIRATGGSARTVTRKNTGPATSKSELADRIAAGTSGKGPIRR